MHSSLPLAAGKPSLGVRLDRPWGWGIEPEQLLGRQTRMLTRPGECNLSEPERFAGVEGSKAHLEWGLLPDGKVERYAHDEAGVAALVQRLVEWNPPLGVMEASGDLGMLWVATGRVAG